VSVVCCEVQVSATGRSLVQMSPIDLLVRVRACVCVSLPAIG